MFLDLDRKNRQLAVQAEQLRRLPGADAGRRPEDGGPGTQGADSARAEEGDAEQRDRITEQLVRIEVLLRGRDSPDGTALADRIAELERSVRRLEATGGAE